MTADVLSSDLVWVKVSKAEETAEVSVEEGWDALAETVALTTGG
jgi:hypothetical protein